MQRGSNEIAISLLPHQVKFLQSEKRYVALCGGFGCGKSYALAAKAYQLAGVNHGFDGALITRSSKQLRDFLLPEVLKFFNAVKAPWSMKDGNKIILNWGQDISVIHLLTTENDAYTRWAGGNLAWSCIDEIDTHLKPAETWSFANDRIRVKAPLLQTACASTPEGYRFLWDFFDNQPARNPKLDDRELIKGCTFDNPYIDEGYVRSQIATRNPLSLRAYVYGDFVNLEGVLVYYRWNKELNSTTKTLADFPTSPLHIGLDFNKGINPAIVNVINDNIVYVVDEIFGSNDIDALIAEFRNRYPGRQLNFYPDASGFEANQQLARAFGSNTLNHPKANPRIERRVAAVNELLCSQQGSIGGTPQGFRRLLVNTEKCPHMVETFNRQTFDKNGAPDKTSGFDHMGDAEGYFINYNWPLNDGGFKLNSIQF